MATVTRSFEYATDADPGYIEMQAFTVDEDGDVWVARPGYAQGADTPSAYIPRPSLELFLRRYDEMVALAQKDDEAGEEA